MADVALAQVLNSRRPARNPGQRRPGGLVLAGAGLLITGLRPGLYLTYTPLTLTRNGGQARASTGPRDAALANLPDALAAAPGHTRSTTLATQAPLAAMPADRRCELTAGLDIGVRPGRNG